MRRVEVGEGGAEWKEDASEASLLNYFIARWVVHENNLNLLDDYLTNATPCGISILEFTACTKRTGNVLHV